ncbi:UNVERIFIED_ORG: hypothetical protein ABID33_000538 [Xanthobacter viscosus]|uniref:Uncharacterized protein n=1 Tax=Xanthobacter autotrophicus TaxID=280 RepID=A0A6C1KJ02_XANAU|nr:hypothetical protein [Xanthobacter autotrophicus]TLX43597.1 hypothetical protein FBQ73_05625 [Xanthobacter autotrophicus]
MTVTQIALDPVVALFNEMDRLTATCGNLADAQDGLENDLIFSCLAEVESASVPTTSEGIRRKIERHFPERAAADSDAFFLCFQAGAPKGAGAKADRAWRELQAIARSAKAGYLSEKDIERAALVERTAASLAQPAFAGIAHAIAEGVRLAASGENLQLVG